MSNTKEIPNYIYEALYSFEAVKSAIDEWNPYSLLPQAPSDEFDSESRMVWKQIEIDSSIDEIATVVSNVFSEMFEPQYFHKEACLDVAKSIKTNLENIRS